MGTRAMHSAGAFHRWRNTRNANAEIMEPEQNTHCWPCECVTNMCYWHGRSPRKGCGAQGTLRHRLVAEHPILPLPPTPSRTSTNEHTNHSLVHNVLHSISTTSSSYRLKRQGLQCATRPCERPSCLNVRVVYSFLRVLLFGTAAKHRVTSQCIYSSTS